MPILSLHARASELARDWGVVITQLRETASSLLAFGVQGTRPTVLKVFRPAVDEWRSTATIEAFAGHGMVRVYASADGAVLLERLTPGASLAELSHASRDDEACVLLADVSRRLTAADIPTDCPTVAHWGRAFDAYLASGDRQIPLAFVEQARERYLALAGSQHRVQLLHGDLHHYNVLYDAARGWVAIDPKGVIGEAEYDLGAFLRNPSGSVATYRSPGVVERRLALFAAHLPVAIDRVAAWAYAQAVLSVVWEVEDHVPVAPDHPTLQLAQTLASMLPQ